ncbi:class I SAM-dependent methyltransferase [Thermococcus sp. GR7]|uniref:class I SAM-dependent methyltransferase n=1 Tax=unclassified Thermococcus TaxID=2627626 RepID=UPI00143087A4|nr:MULTISPECIES: class I SAM-dependent methyltransferase [unclassified Thermococcus]NJE46776.1 class I SAM-dependent methyltransferase [Thermococcus sp. GR7]NJE77796.1 class I SAM-dependent methyltransferase [Thermococcus sp. GR4]NJF22924.1 class I SAM-dependent methyltransferase [Thermococcus sp. GR5]
MSFEKYYTVFKAYSDIYSNEYKKRIKTLEPLLLKHMTSRGKVLDLACGVGGFSFLLEDLGFDVVALDSSESMLEKARKFAKDKMSRVEFVKGNAENLPFEDNSFEYVIFIDSLVHFEPAELNVVFKETARVLKPGGKFILQFTDLRELLPVLMSGQVVGTEYWISRVLPDPEEKTVVIEFQSENDHFRVRFNVWGRTAVELLAKLYFRQLHSEKLNEHSYFQVYTPKK